jgi:hypothetical protein
MYKNRFGQYPGRQWVAQADLSVLMQVFGNIPPGMSIQIDGAKNFVTIKWSYNDKHGAQDCDNPYQIARYLTEIIYSNIPKEE